MRRGRRCHLARPPGLARHRRRRVADRPRPQRAPAEAAGVDQLVDWQRHDLGHTFPTGTYDLVTAQYLHAPIDLPRDRILRAAAAAVAPGGTLLVVGHASSPPWAPHPESHGAFPDPADTAQAIGLHDNSWALLTCEIRERATTDPSGEPATVSDSVVKARRR